MNINTVLKAELILPKYSSMTDIERLDSLTDKNISKKISIHIIDIQQYLNMVDKIIDFEDSTSLSARKAKRTFELHPIIDMSNAMIEMKFKSVLSELVSDSSVLIDSNDESYILSLGSEVISRADELGIYNLRIGQLQEAR